MNYGNKVHAIVTRHIVKLRPDNNLLKFQKRVALGFITNKKRQSYTVGRWTICCILYFDVKKRMAAV